MEQPTLKNVNNCLNTNIYSYLVTSGGKSSSLYLNVVHFLTLVLIRYLWQLNTIVSLHCCLICAFLLPKFKTQITHELILASNPIFLTFFRSLATLLAPQIEFWVRLLTVLRIWIFCTGLWHHSPLAIGTITTQPKKSHAGWVNEQSMFYVNLYQIIHFKHKQHQVCSQ